MTKPISVHWQREPVCTIVPDAKDDRLLLVEDWRFSVKTKQGFKDFTILAGFRFEGSVPRAFWRVITPTDPQAWAGFAVHDFAYLLCKAGLMKREDADEMLFLALRNRFNWLTVRGVYYSVKFFGAAHTKKALTAAEKNEIRNYI